MVQLRNGKEAGGTFKGVPVAIRGPVTRDRSKLSPCFFIFVTVNQTYANRATINRSLELGPTVLVFCEILCV